MNFPEHILQAVADLRSEKLIYDVASSLSCRCAFGLFSSCLVFDDYVVKRTDQFREMKNKYAQIHENGFGHMVPFTEFVDGLVIQEFVFPVNQLEEYRLSPETMFSILNFCLENEVGDIHGANYGLCPDGLTPLIFDFSGTSSVNVSKDNFLLYHANLAFDTIPDTERRLMRNMAEEYVKERMYESHEAAMEAAWRFSGHLTRTAA